MVGPVPGRDAREVELLALREVLAGRELPDGWQVRCRATWW